MYIFMEFRRSILQTYAYVNSLLSALARTGHSEINLSTLLILLSEARGISRSPRTIQRVMFVAADVAEQFGNETVPIQVVRDYLSMQIWTLAQDLFAGIDEVINVTDCDLVKPTTPLGDLLSSRLSCNARTAQCNLATFLSSKRKELQQIRSAMERLRPTEQDARAYDALEQVLLNPNNALGERRCWALGDIIIALSVPDDTLVYTADEHFRGICSAIGKKMFQPD